MWKIKAKQPPPKKEQHHQESHIECLQLQTMSQEDQLLTIYKQETVVKTPETGGGAETWECVPGPQTPRRTTSER